VEQNRRFYSVFFSYLAQLTDLLAKRVEKVVLILAGVTEPEGAVSQPRSERVKIGR
jgi:hypothetical protein